jgi:tetraacyldisaccharide 4'-kinase
MRPHELWEGQSAKERLVRTLVTPLSWLYALGWQAYVSTYNLGIKRPKSPHRPIICIGSLLVGGSGKSPLTHHIADVVLQLGKSVVIGCSGYGSPHSKEAAIAPPGPLHASEWGDEPAMFRWLLPDVPLVVGRNRVLAAKLVHQTYPDSVLVMDDGFQHLPILKQLTIIIDDSEPKNKLCLPAGPHREPRRNRERADLIVPEDFAMRRLPMTIVTTEGCTTNPHEYAVLCALAQPSRFIRTLGARFPNSLIEVPTEILPDHDPLTAPNLWHAFPKRLPIVVTAKDWVKLRDRSDVGERTFLIALQEVSLEPRAEVRNWIERSFNE